MESQGVWAPSKSVGVLYTGDLDSCGPGIACTDNPTQRCVKSSVDADREGQTRRVVEAERWILPINELGMGVHPFSGGVHPCSFALLSAN